MHVTSSGAVDRILERAAFLGVTPSRVGAAAGLDGSDPFPGEWISCARLLALHEAAARLSGDDAFGLHLAEGLSLETFGAMGICAAHGATFGEAIGRAVRHLRSWTNGAEVSFRPEAATVRLEYRMLEPTPPSRHDAEATLGMFLVFARMSGIRDAPRGVAFVHRRPARSAEHQRLFDTPVRFECAVNSLSFDRGWLDHRLPAADPGRVHGLDAQARRLLAARPPRALPARVAAEAAAALRTGDPSLPVVAGRLATSARTLQRRLREQGTSYEALLDDARRQLALQYLNAGAHTVDEIAARLGFAERSPFFRAFRRWTGSTPGVFLERTRAAAHPGAPGTA